MRKVFALSALTLAGPLTMAATPGTPGGGPDSQPWNVDASHTEVNFTVKHFFTPVTGTFKSFDVDLRFDPANPESSSVVVTIDVASIDTKNERRDNHLRSADFFNAEAYPRMTFRSTSVQQVAPDRLLARGELTIKETTKEIELPITIHGVRDLPPEMSEMMGGITEVAGFEAEATIDRREFEVGVANWAQTVIVGGDVEIRVALEANRR